VGRVKREREGRWGSSRGGGAAGWGGGGGEKREEGEVFGEGGGAERAVEGDALGTERAAEGAGGGGGRRGREGGDAGAAEGVAARQHARHRGCGIEGAEANGALRRVRVRWRRGARHGRRFGLASAAEVAAKAY
jgi:hypothetical protein